MSRLTALLVKASRDAYQYAPADRKHELAVAAVLRELASKGDHVEFVFNPEGYIRELADKIQETT